MKKLSVLIVSALISISAYGQETDISVFKNLVGKIWIAEGKWGDGTTFKQETTFTFNLNNTIVIAKSKGFTDQKQTQYGNRNHGIRQFDKKTNTIKFWEFDVFGGLTKGTVHVQGKNMMYQYQYGESLVTDMWEYIDKNTYTFKVGSYENGVWKQIYLETQFKATITSTKM